MCKLSFRARLTRKAVTESTPSLYAEAFDNFSTYIRHYRIKMANRIEGVRCFQEGCLEKRQRGLRRHLHPYGLKFQQRFCRLTAESLDYQKKQKTPKSFPVSRIRTVETVPAETFKKEYCFQIGDDAEVIYLASSTAEERTEWMEAFRKAARNKGNQMLPAHHPGVYQHNKWSCCNNFQRTSPGCKPTASQRSQNRSDMSETFPPSESATSTVAADRRVQSLSRDIIPLMHTDDQVAQSDCAERKEGTLLQVPKKNRSGTADSGYDTRPVSGVSEKDSSPYGQRKHDPKLATQGEEEEEDDFSSQTDEYVEIDSKTLPMVTSMESSHPFEFTPLRTKHLHKAVSTLAWGANDDIFVGSSEDCQVSVLEGSDLSQKKDIKVSTEVTNVDTWGSYLAVGSTVSQIFSKEKDKLLRRMVIAPEDENYKEPSQHLVAFAPTGQLVTACVDGNEIKLWSPPSRESTIQPVTAYLKRMVVDTGHGSICSLVVSPAHEYVQEQGVYPCLAVGINTTADKSTAVHLFDWKTQKHQCTLKTGHGGNVLTTFLPTGSAIVTGCATSLHIWTPTNGTKLCELINALGSQISSLCCSRNGRHFLAGLENGEVKTFELGTSKDTDGCTVNPIFTFNTLETPSAATSIAYSRDERLLAVGHESGILTLWRAPEDDTTAASTDSSHTTSKAKSEEYDVFSGMMFCNEPLLTRMRKIEYYGSEEKYQSTTDGYSIEISKGAFAAGEHVTIQHGVVRYGPFGPFQHHCDLKIVSPIVGFCYSNSNLPMPIKITLPHCINSIYKEELVCLKARHDKCVFENGERMFELKEVQDGEVTKNSNSVTLDTNHLCFYCLGVYCRQETEVANFCLIEVMPTHRERKPYQIHYCLCYLLETCRMVIDEQYSDGFDLRVMRMTFPKGVKDPVLKIKFQRNIPGGWTITRRGPRKIYAREVCFWDLKSTKELVQVHIDKAYPPRFTLEVDGRRATNDGVAEVDFEGIDEDRSIEIPLRLPTAGPPLAINAETQTIPTQAQFEEPIEESTIQKSPSHTITADYTDVESSIYSQQFDNRPHLRLPAAQQQFISLAEPVRNGTIPGAT